MQTHLTILLHQSRLHKSSSHVFTHSRAPGTGLQLAPVLHLRLPETLLFPGAEPFTKKALLVFFHIIVLLLLAHPTKVIRVRSGQRFALTQGHSYTPTGQWGNSSMRRVSNLSQEVNSDHSATLPRSIHHQLFELSLLKNRFYAPV